MVALVWPLSYHSSVSWGSTVILDTDGDQVTVRPAHVNAGTRGAGVSRVGVIPWRSPGPWSAPEARPWGSARLVSGGLRVVPFRAEI